MVYMNNLGGLEYTSNLGHGSLRQWRITARKTIGLVCLSVNGLDNYLKGKYPKKLSRDNKTHVDREEVSMAFCESRRFQPKGVAVSISWG